MDVFALIECSAITSLLLRTRTTNCIAYLYKYYQLSIAVRIALRFPSNGASDLDQAKDPLLGEKAMRGAQAVPRSFVGLEFEMRVSST